MNREGFWYNDYEKDLPMPVANAEPWDGQEEFLETLNVLEISADSIGKRGFSRCRICGDINGSVEYSLLDWAWPAGFRHYVEVHNVKPSDAFIRFAMQEI